MADPVLSHEEIRQAWRKVKKSSGDFVPMHFDVGICDHFAEENLTRLCGQMAAGYQFHSARFIDVPKLKGTLRPGAHLDFGDHVVYRALVEKLYMRVCQNTIRHRLENVVFSHKLRTDLENADPFVHIGKQYSLWRDHILAQVRAGMAVMTTSDVAGYFEAISHAKLFTLLQGYGVPEPELQLLREALRRWSGAADRGIPQGNIGSRLLGELYLDDLDKLMVRKGHCYSRWVDDFRVLAPTLAAARRALQDLIRQLRSLGLVLQGGKTAWATGEQIAQIVDPVAHRKELLAGKVTEEIIEKILAQVDYVPFYDLLSPEAQAWLLEGHEAEVDAGVRAALFDFAMQEQSEINFRYLKYALLEMSRSKDQYAQDKIVMALTHYPPAADRIALYLSVLTPSESIVNSICEYLESEDNVYEWVEMWLLYYISRTWVNLSEDCKSVLHRIVENQNEHFACRYFATLGLSNHADTATLRQLKDRFDEESNTTLKRAIIVAVRRLPRGERNAFYAACTGDSYELEQAARFVKSVGEDAVDRLLGRV